MTAEETRYIVVEGPIGVGKTTLAKALGTSLDCELLLEAPEENPFLERFYRDPRGAALQTQLFFLFQRTRQLEQLRQADLFTPRRMTDFMFDKDALFARLTLDDDEYRLYSQVSERLAVDVPDPDLVVYLQAGRSDLVHRIRQRGIAYEQHIEPEYLERVAEAYARFFHFYDRAPLLIVNTGGGSLVDDEWRYTELVKAVQGHRAGRSYLNLSHTGALLGRAE